MLPSIRLQNMSDQITEIDYIKGLEGTGWENDWHHKTKGFAKEAMTFPTILSVPMDAGKFRTPYHIFMGEDGIPYGSPYNPATNPKPSPKYSMELALEGLAGTDYRVERLGTLFGRTVAFVSIYCAELEAAAPAGERCRLTIHIPLENQFLWRLGLSFTRVVCDNTRNIALAQEDAGGGPVAEVKATKYSDRKFKLVPETVNRAAGVAKLFYMELARLQEIKCDVDGARLLFAGEVARAGGRFAPTINAKSGTERVNRAVGTVDELCSLFTGRTGAIDIQTGTLAGVEQAFTQLFTRGSEGSTKDVFAQIASSERGRYAARKEAFVRDIMNADSRAKLRAMGREALTEANALVFQN